MSAGQTEHAAAKRPARVALTIPAPSALISMGKLYDMSKFARLGGKARAKALTPEQRQEIARQGGIAARGKPRKRRKKKKNKEKTES